MPVLIQFKELTTFTFYFERMLKLVGNIIMKKTLVIIGIVVIIIAVMAGSLNTASSIKHFTLGSNNKGFVTKTVYDPSGASTKNIAIVTGMHPREISAKVVVPEVIKDYAKSNNVKIVNYQVTVTDDPTVFSTGRHNGESLVAKYVIPDIKKSNYDLVIICHDHKKGYGNDSYYIATPSMDAKSIALAEEVHNILPDFNYYQRDADSKTQSTSITGVDDPIVATGTPVFVYEIPEWLNDSDVYSNTNRLIDACFKSI